MDNPCSDSDNRVRLEIDGEIAHIVLNRPEKLNAVDTAMDELFNQFVFEINQNKAIRSVILRGEGDRAFCAGSDLTDLDSYGSNWEYRNRFVARKDYARATWLITKPVVCLIQGYCIGGGLEMACASDFRFSTEDAKFSAGEINHGWHGGSGATQLLSRVVGVSEATRILMTGQIFGSDYGKKVGLIHDVFPDMVALLEAGVEMASRLAEMPPIALQRIKYMLRVFSNLPLESALEVENDSFSYLMLTDDAGEGQQAFKEGRKPRFSGK